MTVDLHHIGEIDGDLSVHIWSVNASPTSYGKIHVVQHDALKIGTGSHLMANLDHTCIHRESKMEKTERVDTGVFRRTKLGITD